MRKVVLPFIAALFAIFAFSAQTAKAGLLDTGQQVVAFASEEVTLATNTAAFSAASANHFSQGPPSRFDGIGFANEAPQKETAIPTTDAKTS